MWERDPGPPLIDSGIALKYEQQRMNVLNRAMQGMDDIVSFSVFVVIPSLHVLCIHSSECVDAGNFKYKLFHVGSDYNVA